MEVRVGEKAPDFALRAYDKSIVTLSQFRGRNVLLLFFPLAFSSTCEEELCFVRDHLAMFESFDAHVIAISVDSLYTLHKFREVNRLNFLLLSDFNKEVIRSFGTLCEDFAYDMKGVAKRSVFLIDHRGILRYKEIQEDPKKNPDFEKIREHLAKISLWKQV